VTVTVNVTAMTMTMTMTTIDRRERGQRRPWLLVRPSARALYVSAPCAQTETVCRLWMERAKLPLIISR
jgi:hypothetical protein